MRRFSLFFFLLIVFACNSTTTEQDKKTEQPINEMKECLPGKDTINLITIFREKPTKSSSQQFQAIVEFISSKGLFKPNTNKAGILKIAKETGKTFPVAYDSCNMKRWIMKNFIMKNIKVTTLGFLGTKKDKFSGFTPGLHFEEWEFGNNTDRDSAMKIVQTAYTYPNNIMMYEKRYSQFIVDDKRILLLEAGAKFAESYAIVYRKLIEQFIQMNYNHNRKASVLDK